MCNEGNAREFSFNSRLFISVPARARFKIPRETTRKKVKILRRNRSAMACEEKLLLLLEEWVWRKPKFTRNRVLFYVWLCGLFYEFTFKRNKCLFVIDYTFSLSCWIYDSQKALKSLIFLNFWSVSVVQCIMLNINM